MHAGRTLIRWIGMLLLGLALALTACGTLPGRDAAPLPGTPDRVRIEINALIPPVGGFKSEVTLTDVAAVRQLYATIAALHQSPREQSCTSELGPSYRLTFYQADHLLITGSAMRYGCRPLSVGGEAQSRQTTQQFWTQLDQAIYLAAPPAHPERLAIIDASRPGERPLVAEISSPAVTQRLYSAILELPLVLGTQGPITVAADYQLLFRSADQAIPASLDLQQNTLALNGSYQSRGGTFQLTPSFQALLRETLAGASFAPAIPDGATLGIQKGGTAQSQVTIGDGKLLQSLYLHTLGLASAQPSQGCPSNEDKLAGKGTWYQLSFTKWSLPLLQLQIYEGSCQLIQVMPGGRSLQGDATFWDLLHHAGT
ncbi:MAG TPA: hypothetical protein VF807_15430 [Ktedonobacterales bacterium]